MRSNVVVTSYANIKTVSNESVSNINRFTIISYQFSLLEGLLELTIEQYIHNDDRNEAYDGKAYHFCRHQISEIFGSGSETLHSVQTFEQFCLLFL